MPTITGGPSVFSHESDVWLLLRYSRILLGVLLSAATAAAASASASASAAAAAAAAAGLCFARHPICGVITLRYQSLLSFSNAQTELQ
jgi:hypothetical protein